MSSKVTYRQQFTRCGKQRCRKCKEGAGHGPYWYAYWSVNGRTVSKYIGKQAPENVVIETKTNMLHQTPAPVDDAVSKQRALHRKVQRISSLRRPCLLAIYQPQAARAIRTNNPHYESTCLDNFVSNANMEINGKQLPAACGSVAALVLYSAAFSVMPDDD